MTDRRYLYEAEVIRWVDGDTVDLRVDLGFRTWEETRFRLYGIDTPERGQPGYSEATAFAQSLAPIGVTFPIETLKDPDKYGRWLLVIHLGDNDSVNSQLVQNGHAAPYFGGKRG